jgi:hypothetical protein
MDNKKNHIMYAYNVIGRENDDTLLIYSCETLDGRRVTATHFSFDENGFTEEEIKENKYVYVGKVKDDYSFYCKNGWHPLNEL